MKKYKKNGSHSAKTNGSKTNGAEMNTETMKDVTIDDVKLKEDVEKAKRARISSVTRVQMQFAKVVAKATLVNDRLQRWGEKAKDAAEAMRIALNALDEVSTALVGLPPKMRAPRTGGPLVSEGATVQLKDKHRDTYASFLPREDMDSLLVEKLANGRVSVKTTGGLRLLMPVGLVAPIPVEIAVEG